MDIQKEREAFEQWYLQHYYTRNGLNPDGDIFKSYHDCDGWNYLYDSVFKAWVVWQAAKAQSDKKIKLLLCDEHLQKCESPTGVFNSQYPDEEPCLICLAKEAKAQAVPEGFVLVPREPTQKMLENGKRQSIQPNYGRTDVLGIYKAMIEAQELAND